MEHDVRLGLFDSMDNDGDGTISWNDFCSFLLGGEHAENTRNLKFLELAKEAGPLVRGVTRTPRSKLWTCVSTDSEWLQTVTAEW